MKKTSKNRLLKLLLLALLIALIAVVGYIALREYQYSVSDEYYDSLRKTGLLKGVWKA